MKTLTTSVLIAALLAAVGAMQAQQRPSKRGDMRMATRLQVGDTAPDFKLKTKDGSGEVQLSSFRGKKPVVLVFGSVT